MKNIVIFLILPCVILASGQKLNTFEYMSIKNTNHRPSQKLSKQRRMHKLHRINEKQAEKIVSNIIGEKTNHIKISRKGRYLIYTITTDNYKLILNALDGTVIKKQKH